MMRAVRIHRSGGPEVLQVESIPVPEPGPDEVLVAVVASTINPVDVKTRTPGTPQQVSDFPTIQGWDVAGIVLEAPSGSGWGAGDRVIAMNPPSAGSGSWADIVAVPAERVVAAPRTLDLVSAATLPLAGLTALQALGRLDPQAGDRVLVTGAAGAVGGFAVQILAGHGHHVTGLGSRPGHLRTINDLGAAHAATEPASLGEFDAVVDTAGVYDPRLLAENGRLVTVSDDEIPAAVSERASLAVHNYVKHDAPGLRVIADLADAGMLTPRIADRYPLPQVRAAHERFEAGGLDGKVVILT